MKVPKRKVISATRSYTTPSTRRMRKPFFVRLECGHADIFGATDAKEKELFCWDCFYKKPVVFSPGDKSGHTNANNN